MRLTKSPIIILLLLITLGWLPTVQAGDPQLIEVGFSQASEREEVVIFKLSEVTIPKVFGIEGEKPRIVCDFLDTKLAAGVQRDIEPRGKLIRAVRVGLHNTPSPMIRIVLDLIPGPDYDIQQTMLTDDKIFTIRVNLSPTKQNVSPTSK